jgi:hypothetical protein
MLVKEPYITMETSQLAWNAGYTPSTPMVYSKAFPGRKPQKHGFSMGTITDYNGELLPAVPQSVLKAWLRVECDTHVDAHLNTETRTYSPSVKIGNFVSATKGKPRHTYTEISVNHNFPNYEQALEIGFREALRHLISRRISVLRIKSK